MGVEMKWTIGSRPLRLARSPSGARKRACRGIDRVAARGGAPAAVAAKHGARRRTHRTIAGKIEGFVPVDKVSPVGRSCHAQSR